MSARIQTIGSFDGGRQVAYRLDPPLNYLDIKDISHLLVVHNKDHGQDGWEPKTFIYPCDAKGRQTSYLELEIWAGAHLDHAKALDDFVAEIEGFNEQARQKAARLSSLYRLVSTDDGDGFPLSHYQLTEPLTYGGHTLEHLVICDTLIRDSVGRWVPGTFIYPATADGKPDLQSPSIQTYRGHSPHQQVVERFICQIEAEG